MPSACGIWPRASGHKLDNISGAYDGCPLLDRFIMSIVSQSKTSLMDPRFGPAWIAFAHTFALEGEHDHAVTAYSTCARMFTG